MNHYSYHSHTADVIMKVRADTLNELYETAMRGTSNLLKNNFCNQILAGSSEKKIVVRSVDRIALLIDFLSEVLLSSHINKAIYCNLNIVKLTDQEIEATISGSSVEYFDEDIKAVTYHEANVFKHKNNQWEASIIFDI